MHALVRLCINEHTTLDELSFTDSKDMIGGKIKKRVTWPWPRRLWANLLSQG